DVLAHAAPVATVSSALARRCARPGWMRWGPEHLGGDRPRGLRVLLLVAVAGCGCSRSPTRVAPPPREVADAGAAESPTRPLSPIDATNAARLERVHGAYESIESVTF